MSHDNHTNNDGPGTNRPRRPSPDTIAYLRSLPLDYETTRSEIQRYQDHLRLQSLQQRDDDDDDAIITEMVEFPTSLAVAIQAIYEIQHEMASIAGDEQGSEMIELLCHITIPVSKTICRIILQGIGGGGSSSSIGTGNSSHPQQYAVHLATHRYGSHVLQTILQLSSQYCSNTSTGHDDYGCTNNTDRNGDDLALHADAPLLPSSNNSSSNNSDDDDENHTRAATIMDHILHIASSLHPVATDLMVHICGSHCLRTILCILGNVTLTTTTTTTTTTNTTPPIQQRRGKVKSSKKKKKKADVNHDQHDTSRNPLTEPRMMYPSSSHWSLPTTEMMDMLHQFTTSLTAVLPDESTTTTMVGPGPLQSWVCHTSAGPVITVLLQVWAYYEYAKEQDDTWDTLRQQQLQWEVRQTTPDRHICLQRPEPRYQVGSMTDTIIRRILCWRNDIEQQTYGSDVLYGYAGEPRGSHCLETILRIAPDTIHEQILTSCSIYDTATMREYIHDTVSNFVLQTMLQTIRTSEQARSILKAIEPNMAFILDPINKRRWIAWRMVELAVTYTECQGIVIDMITNGFTNLQQQSTNNTNTNAAGTPASDKVKRKLNKCINPLLNIIPPKQHGERVGVDIAGTRMVYYLLQYQTEFCSDTIKGIMELSPNDMELLIKDPFVSRCIFDEIMTSNHSNVTKDNDRSHSMYINAQKRLVTKLQNRWVNIATDRVGYHMIKQLFVSLDDIHDKKLIVEELITGKNRMNGNSMGRNVLDALYVRIYETNGETEWVNTMKRQTSKQEWLKEIIDTKKETTNQPHLKDKSSTAMDVNDEWAGNNSNNNKRNTSMNEIAENTENNKKKQRVSKSVDTIMDAISIPKRQ